MFQDISLRFLGTTVVVPAHAAYSHSASVGSLYSWSSAIRPAARSCWVSFSQYFTAYFHVMFSTGWFGTLKWGGLFPMTCSYSCCVTSWSHIQNPSVSLTVCCSLSVLLFMGCFLGVPILNVPGGILRIETPDPCPLFPGWGLNVAQPVAISIARRQVFAADSMGEYFHDSVACTCR